MQSDDIGLAIQESAAEIVHFHISQPNLSDFSEATPYHSVAADGLARVGYDRWLCIEMLETADPEKSVTDAVKFVKNFYFRN